MKYGDDNTDKPSQPLNNTRHQSWRKCNKYFSEHFITISIDEKINHKDISFKTENVDEYITEYEDDHRAGNEGNTASHDVVFFHGRFKK